MSLKTKGVDDEVESNAGAPSVAGSVTGPTVDDSLMWPSMQDLNTRLRRVITAYQRNYKKEELKQQQKAKVNLSKHFYFRHVYQSKNYCFLCKSTLLSKVFLKILSTTIIILLKSGVNREKTKKKKLNRQALKPYTKPTQLHMKYLDRFFLYFVSNFTERTFV